MIPLPRALAPAGGVSEIDLVLDHTSLGFINLTALDTMNVSLNYDGVSAIYNGGTKFFYVEPGPVGTLNVTQDGSWAGVFGLWIDFGESDPGIVMNLPSGDWDNGLAQNTALYLEHWAGTTLTTPLNSIQHFIECDNLVSVDIGASPILHISAEDCPLLETLDFGALNDGEWFVVTGCALDQETIDAALSICAGGTKDNATFTATGASMASPSVDTPATAGTGEIVCPAGADLETTETPASWVKPQWKTTQRYFWFSNGTTQDPAAGGTGVPVAFDGSETAEALAALLEAAMEANGYSSSVATNTISYTLDVTGSGATAGSQDAGNDFTLQAEADGTDPVNNDIDTLRVRGWTVTVNGGF